MMKIKSNLIISFVLGLLITGCSEEPTSPTGDFEVSGRVISKGIAVENAIVKLDKSEALKTATNSEGNFKLLNVPEGNYELTVSKNLTDGTFSERTSYIAVDSDTNLDNLILPKGITVYEPNSMTDKALLLAWSPTDAADFREYKIYQHSTSGLDETTGTLIHVSTSIDDTTFTVESLNPLTNYYFRVYVMNDFGRLGGSNIVSITTLNKQVIINGSFETIDNNFPIGWNRSDSDTYNMDSVVVQNGKYSLNMSTTVRNGHYIDQLINPNNIEAGARYKLTYWIKHEAFDDGSNFFVVLATQSRDWEIYMNSVGGPQEARDWTQYSVEFNVPVNLSPSNYIIRFWLEVWRDPFIGWIDNISLTKVE